MRLPGRNPYRDQVQGRALECQAVVDLLRRAAESIPGTLFQPTAEEVVHRLSENSPRVAVISGSLDHTAHLRDHETVLLLAREVWKQGGVPFTFGLPTVCDGTAQSTLGMSYSLYSRNVASETVITQMEAHSYHGAIVIQGCDKTPFAVLNGLVLLDRLRQERGDHSVSAVFAPVHVLRGGNLSENTRARLLQIAGCAEKKEGSKIGQEIREVLGSILLCTTNQSFQAIFERGVAEGFLSKKEKLQLENEIAAATSHPAGGMCSFNGTGNSTRFVMAALGLVPPSIELLCRPAGEEEVEEVVASYLRQVVSKEGGVLSFVEKNFSNAVRCHSSMGGSTNLILHLVACMNYAGYDFSIEDYFRIKDREILPDLLRYSLLSGRDIFRLALERKRGGHRGVESVYGLLHELGIKVDLLAPTVTGKTWKQRIRGGSRIQSELLGAVPVSRRSGIDRFRSNFFSSAVVKISGMSQKQRNEFNRRVFFVLYCENEEEATELLQDEHAVKKKILKGLTSSRLKTISRLHGGSNRKGSKETILNEMWEEGRLKLAFLIAGQGPAAFGMPEMFTPMQIINSSMRLREASMLLTDGRYSGVTQGPAFGHVSPEAFHDGGILFLKTGDLLYVDFEKCRVDLLDSQKFDVGRTVALRGMRWAVSRKSLGEERKKRMVRRQSQLAACVRLDQASSVEYGVVPRAVQELAGRTFKTDRSGKR